MRKASIIFSVVVIIGIGWVYLFTGTPPWGPKFTPKSTNVVSIELLWGGKLRATRDSKQCAEVLRTMSRARHCEVVGTPSFGYMIINYADGSTNQFFLSPSSRTSALQMAAHGEGYAISFHEMLEAFQKVGLLSEDGT